MKKLKSTYMRSFSIAGGIFTVDLIHYQIKKETSSYGIKFGLVFVVFGLLSFIIEKGKHQKSDQ